MENPAHRECGAWRQYHEQSTQICREHNKKKKKSKLHDKAICEYSVIVWCTARENCSELFALRIVSRKRFHNAHLFTQTLKRETEIVALVLSTPLEGVNLHCANEGFFVLLLLKFAFNGGSVLIYLPFTERIVWVSGTVFCVFVFSGCAALQNLSFWYIVNDNFACVFSLCFVAFKKPSLLVRFCLFCWYFSQSFFVMVGNWVKG